MVVRQLLCEIQPVPADPRPRSCGSPRGATCHAQPDCFHAKCSQPTTGCSCVGLQFSALEAMRWHSALKRAEEATAGNGGGSGGGWYDAERAVAFAGPKDAERAVAFGSSARKAVASART